MVEENETPDASLGHGDVERDLLAQRRARRAESSDPGMIRRAEAAEATVHTLETQVLSLQQRLQEATDEQRRVGEQLAERELEVRRVKQREYAEQQLRVEAEDRCERAVREKRAEIEELHRRLSTSERSARELADQLEEVRRELAEAQHAAVAERVAIGHDEQQLADREADLDRRERALEQARVEVEQRLGAARDFEQRARAIREQAEQRRDMLSTRLTELESQAAEVQLQIQSERAVRESQELNLGRTEEGRAALQLLVDELEQTAQQLGGAIEQERATLQSQLQHQRDQLRAEHVSELQHQSDRLRAEHSAELHSLSEHASQLQRQREQLDAQHTGELAQMRARVSELEQELERTAAELHSRPALSIEPPDQLPEETAPPIDSTDEQRKQEMTEALAAAVERLRTRVANTGEHEHDPQPSQSSLASPEQPELSTQPQPPVAAPQPPHDPPVAPDQAPAADFLTHEPAVPPQPSSAATAPEPSEGFTARVLQAPDRRRSWLSPALRSVAEKRDAKLAGELIVELLVAQRLVVEQPITYVAEIDELGSFCVKLDGAQSKVEKVSSPTSDEKIDFLLKGPAAGFSELAGGGTGWRLPGLKVRGGKRAAKQLRLARRAPVTLADLAGAGVRIWPGLLLLAMAEAIDPAWTKDHRFVLDFQITGEQTVSIYVCVSDGEPVRITRTCEEQPGATVAVSELSLLCLLAAVPIPHQEHLQTTGEAGLLRTFLEWTDRSQGLIAAE
ncbi:MAG TPA: hypothetical protein VID48_03820 [Solirubrobacteraceae bacterium]